MTDHTPVPYTGPTRVLSGVQPSGALHLGNYLGALVKFAKLQHEMDTFIFVADLHAITVWQEPEALAQQTREIAAAYLAAGLDPAKATIFPQSAVREHAELAWIFQCVARLGWLDRMTQFKEKSGKHKERSSVGLYTYPVLQAADILVYKATHVPVGEDQKQHLELTRDIAAKFNHDFGVQGFFPQPEPLIQGPGARVMSLRDGSAKMSKSDPSDYSRINLTDDADTIAGKVKKARTDPEPLPETQEELTARPEADNLVGIFAALSGRTKAEVLAEYAGKGFGTFKPALADLAVEKLAPVGETMRRFLADPTEIDRILKAGAERASEVAAPTVAEVKKLVGFWGEHNAGDAAAKTGWAQVQTVLASTIGERSVAYRNDIDGLRAVAIVPILLFHAGLTRMSGGFVGVDIFFVISGFLITSIISREIDARTFSILNFYRRRVLRIVPALYVMLAAVLLAGCLVMLPNEADSLGRSAAATSGFVSNFYFWRTADYFGGSADLKPLLHTWSLGVEEQFYVLYPLLMMGVMRWFRRWLAVGLGVMVLASFGLSLVLAFVAPNAAFYLLPSRAWELGLGGLIALGAFPSLPWRAARQAASATGLALIVAGLCLVRADDPLPAPWALLPCVGAALLIAYGESTAAGRLLSIKPLRWLGAISYSLYLAHWPIIALYRLQTGVSLTAAESLGLVLASIAAAALSYYVVERPILARFGNSDIGKTLGAAGGLLAVGLAASLVVSGNAQNWRPYSPEARHIMSYTDYVGTAEHLYQYRSGTCFIGAGNQVFDRAQCLRLSATKPNVVILGDSHAAQYWRAIALRYPDRNVMQATTAGCRPTLHARGKKRCTDLVTFVLGDFLRGGGIDTVVLAGRWRNTDVADLVSTVRFLKSKGVKVVVIGPTVEYDGEFPHILTRAMMLDGGKTVSAMRLTDRIALDERLARLMSMESVVYVSEQAIECPAGRCMPFAPGKVPFHFDYGHMPLSAARYVISKAPEF